MKRLNRSLLYSVLLLLISCLGSKAQTNHWTRFRGSDGHGIDLKAKAPVSWDSTDYKWTIELPGIGNASPVVWDNKIFVTSALDEKDLGYLISVDGNNGKIIWQKEFRVTDLALHENNKLAAPTPAVDESHVYTLWVSKEKISLTALSHDGSFKWQSEFGGIEARHGGGSSLMLTEKFVVFTREQEEGSSLKSSWVAVNKLTGETAWELERESATANSFSTPILLKTNDHADQLIFGSQAHGLTGVDPETGKILWERKGMLTARVVASPIYSDGMIVISRKGVTMVVDLDPNTNQALDTARYSLPRNLSTYVPTPIVMGDLLYIFMDNGTASCLRLITGELLWKERPAGAIFGSPVCVGGNLYCISKSGEVIVIQADAEYKLQGISPLGEGSFSTPVMCKSGMVFQTFSKLMLLGVD